MLELVAVSKSYPGKPVPVQVLQQVSFRVSPGEFVAVQGPSGCGKTTLLLILGGLLAPTGGRMVWEGEDVYALTAEARAQWRARRIGMVFQQFHLIPYLSIEENILAPTLAFPVADARARLETLVQQFQLTERRHHVPSALSTGERQRTALARALLTHPACLLVDEPTGNLDAANAAIVTGALTDYTRQDGMVVMVTHDAGAAAQAQRRVVLQHARIEDVVS